MGAEAVGVRPIQITRDGVTAVSAINAVSGATIGEGWDFPVIRSLLDAKSLL
jgi:hypothetical protein